MAKKPKTTRFFKYRAGDARIRSELLPERLPYMAEGARLLAMEIREAGSFEDGREYQLVYVEVQPPPERRD